MKKTFNKQYLLENRGCYTEEQAKKTSCFRNNCTLEDFLLSTDITLKDKFWFVFRKIDLTIKEKQELAIICAETVLEIYEKKYPSNRAPREAIQAAKDYLNGLISIDTLISKRDATAYAATAATAYAATAYAATAYAATAAAYAATAAAYATDAATAAAYATDATDADDYNSTNTFQKLLLINLIIFCNLH